MYTTAKLKSLFDMNSQSLEYNIWIGYIYKCIDDASKIHRSVLFLDSFDAKLWLSHQYCAEFIVK